MTQAQYARWRKSRGLPGGTREGVRKAVLEQRIELLANGRIDRRAADRAWAERSLPKVMPPDNAGASPDSLARLVSTRAAREEVRKELDQHRLNLATGVTVLRLPILSAATEAARKMQDRMRVLARHLGPIVAAIADPEECVRIIDGELQQACSSLTKPIELLAPGEPVPGAPDFAGPALAPLPPPAPVARGRFGR